MELDGQGSQKKDLTSQLRAKSERLLTCCFTTTCRDTTLIENIRLPSVFLSFFFASSVFLFYEQRVFQLLKVIETHLRGDMFIDNAYYDSLVTHFLKPLSTVSAMSFHFTTCTSSSIFNRLYWLPSIRWANKIQLNLQCCKMHNSRYIRYLLQIPVLFFPCLPVFLDTCILWASRRGFPFIWGRTFVFEGLRNHVEMFITIIFPKVDK